MARGLMAASLPLLPSSGLALCPWVASIVQEENSPVAYDGLPALIRKIEHLRGRQVVARHMSEQRIPS